MRAVASLRPRALILLVALPVDNDLPDDVLVQSWPMLSTPKEPRDQANKPDKSIERQRVLVAVVNELFFGAQAAENGTRLEPTFMFRPLTGRLVGKHMNTAIQTEYNMATVLTYGPSFPSDHGA